MLKRPSLILILPVLALGACTTTTPYQPLTKGKGYAEQKIEGNRFRVTFDGNFRTSKQRVEDYLLYRAAELTLANGGDYFIIADQGTEADTRYTQTFSGFGSDVFFPSRVGVGVAVGTAVPTTEYQSQADILIFKGKKPADNPKAYNAREIQINLGPLITRPKN